MSIASDEPVVEDGEEDVEVLVVGREVGLDVVEVVVLDEVEVEVEVEVGLVVDVDCEDAEVGDVVEGVEVAPEEDEVEVDFEEEELDEDEEVD